MPNVNSLREDDDINDKALAQAAIDVSRKRWWENTYAIWIIQGGSLFIWLLVVGYLTLWMDNHNDVRYIPKAEYRKDQDTFNERYKENREADRKERQSIRDLATSDKNELGKRLDRQEVQLDTIANDIKSLLRQAPRNQ